MEPKSKNLEQNFWFLIVCLLASFTYAEISSEKLNLTESMMSPSAKLSQDMNTPSVKIQEWAGTGLKRQLWQVWISAAKSKKDEKSKTELQQLIEQVLSVEFKPRQEVPEPVIAVESAKPGEPNEGLSAKAAPKEPNEIKSEAKPVTKKLPYEPVTEQTLQMLESLLQHPEQLHMPFELAEVLFLSGHLKQAAVCYQEALNRIGVDEDDPARNREWILFQIGNCLRDDDMPAAMRAYRQLIAEYSDSPWVDLAKTRSKLIEWYQKDKPKELIAESKF